MFLKFLLRSKGRNFWRKASCTKLEENVPKSIQLNVRKTNYSAICCISQTLNFIWEVYKWCINNQFAWEGGGASFHMTSQEVPMNDRVWNYWSTHSIVVFNCNSFYRMIVNSFQKIRKKANNFCIGNEAYPLIIQSKKQSVSFQDCIFVHNFNNTNIVIFSTYWLCFLWNGMASHEMLEMTTHRVLTTTS